MDCEQFEDALHEMLDERSQPELSESALKHMSQCTECRSSYRGWQVIERAFEHEVKPAVSESRPSLRAPLAMAAVGLLLVVTVAARQHVQSNRHVAAGEQTNAAFKSLSHLNAPETRVTVQTGVVESASQTGLSVVTAPAQIWIDLSSDSWVQQTMPAMRSVREGMAPIGRSIRFAVTLLTTSPVDTSAADSTS